MTKYTQGPWTVSNKQQVPIDKIHVRGNNDALICEISTKTGWEAHKDRADHNAKLIAAAPDLLDALEIAATEIERATRNMLLNGYEPHSVPVKTLKHAAEYAYNVIAEAKGVDPKHRNAA